MKFETFEEWHSELTRLAREKDCGWLIPPCAEYPRDGWLFGLTPEEELEENISEAVASC